MNPLSLIKNASPQFKLILVLCLFLAGFLLGGYSTYKVIGWKNDSEELAINNAKAEFVKLYREHETSVSKQLQTKLDSLKANEREIIREIPKIITRDIYRNDCIDDDGLLLIESARTGGTNTTKPSK